MLKLLKKELTLSASVLSFLFIAFGFMTLIPGYPILMGAFFVCQGIFFSFQKCREESDILYLALLPVRKSDVVRSKFAFSIFIELCAFLLMSALTLCRMTFLADAPAYLSNVLMTANPVYLAFVLLIFGGFNLIFIRGFFKTAYKFAKPFIGFVIWAVLLIGLAEVLHHIPGLEALNSSGFENPVLTGSILCGGIVLYLLMTLAAVRASIRSFEKIDL